MVDFWCGGGLVCLMSMWWVSYFTFGVVDVWFTGCLVWWMSGVVDVCVVDDRIYYIYISWDLRGHRYYGTTRLLDIDMIEAGLQ